MRRVALVLAVIASVVCGASQAHAQQSWDSLVARDGVVVLMRHALAPGFGDPVGFELGDCRTQRNLSAEGRRQARGIGREIRASGVQVAAVYSSPWCRARDTARGLGLGGITIRDYLGSSFQKSADIAAAREARTRRAIVDHADQPGVLIMVGHQANIVDLTGIAPGSGEAVAVRADDDGTLQILGTIQGSTGTPRERVRGGT